MGRGRMAGGVGALARTVLAAALFGSIALVSPAAAAPLPECPPFTFDELGPPPNGPVADPAYPMDPMDPIDPPETTIPPPEQPPTEDPPAEPECEPFSYEMLHPLVTGGDADSVFGAVRDAGDRWHAGVDILAPKLTPVVAVADATVSTIVATPESMSITLRHRDGWWSLYVHLNNDTAATDDGLGVGVRPDLAVGDRLEAGTVIGWVGDSSNAEDGPAHLHFELRNPDFVAVDPLTSIRGAESLFDDPAPFRGSISDDDDHPDEWLFDRAVSVGLEVWCDDQGLTACPDSSVTREQLLEWTATIVPHQLAGLRTGFILSAEFQLFSLPRELGRFLDCQSPLLCDQEVTGSELSTLLVGVQATSAPCAAPIGDRPATRAEALRHLFRLADQFSEPPCQLIS